MNTPAPSEDLLVFISYRREDSAGHAGRLFDDLARRFRPEQLFMDVDAIRPGEDFAASIREAVGRSQALVALIGPRWLTAQGADGRRRLDDEGDYVRLEIETALERDILVIPVLLQDARMPKPADLPVGLRALARRNSMQLRDPTWRSDLEILASGLARLGASQAATLRGHSDAFWTAAPGEVELPYLGLRAFEEDDARFYFGREDDVAQLVERLSSKRFLAVFGPSGSGKSSLVRAGLAKAVRAGDIKGSASWPVVILRPGARPLETLAAEIQRLVPGRSMAELVDALAADHRTLHLETARALADRPGATRLLWVIDQAEELFTLCHDEEQRSAAIANIVHAGTVDGGSGAVVLAMRADFYHRCALYPDLAAAISASQYLVSPMSEAGLRRAIEGPAEVVGLSFEPGLVDTIIDDVSTQPGGLPLLEHALLELYERRRGTTLTLEGYRAAGGVEGALAKRAESVYAELGVAEKDVARRVMLRLTQPGEGTVDTRRRSSLRDLPSGPWETGPVQHVIDQLADARLVTLGAEGDAGEPVVEISHEALLRAWPRVREWIDQDREALRVQRRIADAAAEWQRLKRVDDALLRGIKLAEANDWQARQPDLLNDAERAFVTASTAANASAQATADRRRRLTVFAALGVAAVFIGLSVLTFAAYRGSEAALNRALAAESAANDTIAQLALKQAELDQQRRVAIGRALVNEAARENQTSDLSLLLGLEARAFAGPDANAVLLDEIYEWQSLERTIRLDHVVGGNGVFAVADDLSMAAYVRDDALVTRDLDTGEEQSLGRRSSAEFVAFSPDKRMLLAAGVDVAGNDRLSYWTLADGTEHPLATEGVVGRAAISQDGNRIAAHASLDGRGAVTVWTTLTGVVELTVELRDREFRTLALSGDGSTLAIETGTAEGTDLRIEVWDVERGTSRRLPAVPEGSTGDTRAFFPPLAFDPTGEILAIPRSDAAGAATVDLWSMAEPMAHLEVIQIGSFIIDALAFSKDGSELAVGGDEVGTSGAWIYAFDAAGRIETGTFVSAPIGGVDQVRFVPDATKLFATSSFGGAVAVWSIGAAAPPDTRMAPAELAASNLVAIGPGGQRLAFNSPNQEFDEISTRIDVLDVESGAVRTIVEFPDLLGAVALGSTADAYADSSTLWIVPHEGGDATSLARANVSAAAFSGDSRTLAVAHTTGAFGDGGAAVVEILGGEGLTTTRRYETPGIVQQVAFSPDGTRLVVASIADPIIDATTLTIYALAERAGTVFERRLPGNVRSLAWSTDGSSITAIRGDRALMSWDFATGLVTSTSNTPLQVDQSAGASQAEIALAFRFLLSPEGDRLFTGGPEVLGWATSVFNRPIESIACAIAGRNLSQAEWDRNLPGEPYSATCPEFVEG